MGIKRPLAGHGFDRVEFYDNFTLIDGYPGTFLCTSGTRPSGWGSPHIGMKIFETDTSLTWRWNGTAFVRDAPMGLLGTSTITADASTAATAATNVITVAVTVPTPSPSSTAKRIKVEAEWYAIDNGTATTLGASFVYLLRGGTVLAKKRLRGRPDTASDELEWGEGGSIGAWDSPSAGAQSYHLAISTVASVGGTTTLRASPTTPAQLAVTEVGL